MTQPQPLSTFKRQLLQSEDIQKLIAKEYGTEADAAIGLAQELFPSTKLLPLEAARKLEIDHANALREREYAVWQK